MKNFEFELSKLINEWKDFYTECKEGYSGSIYEFDYDLLIRDNLQDLLISENLQVFKNKFSGDILMIDNDFIDLLIFLDKNDYHLPFWKRKIVLKFARKEYVNDVSEIFSIEIGKVSD